MTMYTFLDSLPPDRRREVIAAAEAKVMAQLARAERDVSVRQAVLSELTRDELLAYASAR